MSRLNDERGPEQLVRINFDRCAGMSQKAYMLTIDDEAYWVPQSLVRDSSGLRVGEDDCWVVIPEWKAIALGLEAYSDPA